MSSPTTKYRVKGYQTLWPLDQIFRVARDLARCEHRPVCIVKIGDDGREFQVGWVPAHA